MHTNVTYTMQHVTCVCKPLHQHGHTIITHAIHMNASTHVATCIMQHNNATCNSYIYNMGAPPRTQHTTTHTHTTDNWTSTSMPNTCVPLVCHTVAMPTKHQSHTCVHIEQQHAHVTHRMFQHVTTVTYSHAQLFCGDATHDAIKW